MSTTPADVVRRVLEAVDVTARLGTARVAFTVEHRMPTMPDSAPRSPMDTRLGRRVERVLTRPRVADGLIDFECRLTALDHGLRAELIMGGRLWSGPAGEEHSSVKDVSADWEQPLWLLDVLRGAVEAWVEKSEPVRGEPCDRLAVRADLLAAAEACPDPIAAPALPRYADLRRLPVSCWIDAGSLVRRVRVDLARVSATVDLIEFGVAVPHEWSSLPGRPAGSALGAIVSARGRRRRRDDAST